MKRLSIAIPDSFAHEIVLRVRISDVNYGGHLGNDAVLALIQEARLAFLASWGFSEIDAGGVGLIMTDAALSYRAQAFHGDALRIGTAVEAFARTGFRLVHRVVHDQRGVEVARASIGLACFDYTANRVARMPDALARQLRGAGGDKEHEGRMCGRV